MVLVTAKSMNGGSANTSTEFEQDLRSLMASADDFVRTKTATVCVFPPKVRYSNLCYIILVDFHNIIYIYMFAMKGVNT
jgi:hypothetical protein